jgi:ribose 1,5-bisphosphokinase PhnN
VIKLKSDMSEVAAFVGAAEGYLGSIETPIYLDDLLRICHAKTKEKFNAEAAVFAAATKSISHAFEWGAAGINSAPGTAPIKPTSPLGRLWYHSFPGRAGRRKIDFEFRASRVPVPLPDPDSSGLDEDFLSSQGPSRRHFFYWKAPMMEYGIPVEIKPKYAKALFIPLGGATSPNPRAEARGYAMTSKAVRMVPGRRFAGQFSAYWEAWWTTAGYKDIQLTAQAVANNDSRAVIPDTSAEARKYVGGVSKKAFRLDVSTARAKARMEMANRTRKRRRLARAAENKELGGGKKFTGGNS